MNHFYKNIQGMMAFEFLYQEVVHRYPSGSHFVEVGCWKGQSAAYMAVEIINSGKDIQFDCVDLWKVLPYMRRHELNKDDIFEDFVTNTEPVAHVIRAIQKDSVEAAHDYPDDSLDFVFIDTVHTHEVIQADVRAWLPKIRRGGGMIAGDDAHLVESGLRELERLGELPSSLNIGPRVWTATV